jgi:hypothetical protein
MRGDMPKADRKTTKEKLVTRDRHYGDRDDPGYQHRLTKPYRRDNIRCCGEERVQDRHNGDRLCHTCGSVGGKVMHGPAIGTIDVETGKDRRQHARLHNERFTRTKFCQQTKYGRHLGVADQYSKSLRQCASDTGIKADTFYYQKVAARDILKNFCEQTTLHSSVGAKAAKLFDAYRDSHFAKHLMNFKEVLVAAMLSSLPPETTASVGHCGLVVSADGHRLETSESCKIMKALGHSRGGMKLRLLSRTSLHVQLEGHRHHFAERPGRTVLQSSDGLILRFDVAVCLPPGQYLRLEAVSGRRTVSRIPIVAKNRENFKGILHLQSPATALRFTVVSYPEVKRRIGFFSKRKTKLHFEKVTSELQQSHKMRLRKDDSAFSIMCAPWYPRVSLRAGCGHVFPSLHAMKYHECTVASARKKTGKKKSPPPLLGPPRKKARKNK